MIQTETTMGQKHSVDSTEIGGDVPGSSLMGQNHGVISSVGGRGGIVSGPSPFDDLPEDCISNIISFTSPPDACISASVSKTFESAVQSDSVWEKFLLSEYASLVPQYSLVFSSKKELYFALCDHFLIEDARKMQRAEENVSGSSMGPKFGIDSRSKDIGEIVSRLSPFDELPLDCVSNTISLTSPRDACIAALVSRTFRSTVLVEKVPELLDVCAFEIRGWMNTRILSPRTHYSAYVVYKTRNGYHGFRDLPIQVGIGLVGQKPPKRFICFDESTDKIKRLARRELMKSEERGDGWIEAEIGEFFNDGGLSLGCDEIEVSVVDITSPYWKCGLIIQGIEFRPAKR